MCCHCDRSIYNCNAALRAQFTARFCCGISGATKLGHLTVMSTTSGAGRNEGMVASGLPAERKPVSPFWRFADLSVLAVWVLVTRLYAVHDEKWADEAQSLAAGPRSRAVGHCGSRNCATRGIQDCGISLLWLAQRLFDVPYSGLGVIGLVCATSRSSTVMLLRAPFPKICALAFGFFLLTWFTSTR